MLQLRPVPSRLRWLLALAAHGLAAAALFHAGAPGWLKLILAPFVPASLWREAMIFLGRKEAAELCLSAGSAELWIDGEAVTAGQARALHCSELMIVIEFPVRGAESGRRRFTLVLFPDSLPAGDMRRLRRWLNYESG